jgi:hypothetical protein
MRRRTEVAAQRAFASKGIRFTCPLFASGSALALTALCNESAQPFVGRTNMFILLAVVLAVAWILGFTVMKVSSLAIHILLAVALASVVVHLLRRGRRSA